jgi:hypothetical protein
MRVTRITVSIPAPQLPMLVSNLLGVASLIGLVVSIGALAGNWWWSTLSGSLAGLGLAWVAMSHAQAAADAAASQPAGAGEAGPAAGPPLRVAGGAGR